MGEGGVFLPHDQWQVEGVLYPLSVEGDIRVEGIACAISVGCTAAVNGCVPPAKRVAGAGEGVERQRSWQVGRSVVTKAICQSRWM